MVKLDNWFLSSSPSQCAFQLWVDNAFDYHFFSTLPVSTPKYSVPTDKEGDKSLSCIEVTTCLVDTNFTCSTGEMSAQWLVHSAILRAPYFLVNNSPLNWVQCAFPAKLIKLRRLNDSKLAPQRWKKPALPATFKAKRAKDKAFFTKLLHSKVKCNGDV